MFRIAIAILFLFLLASGVYYRFYYPPTIFRHKTEAALDISEIVATKDRAKIGQALQKLLADNAQLRLDIAFAAPAMAEPASGENFNKRDFITFIDNTLYSLTDYGYKPRLADFSLSADHRSADITFTARGWAEGMSYNAGISINMYFSASADCTGHVVFDQETPKLDKAACTVTLRMAPRNGQAR